MRRAIIAGLSLVVLAVLFVVLCTYVRRPYESIIVVRFGKPVEETAQTRIAYNWYLKWPTDSVNRFDTRLHLYTSPLKEVVTGSKETIAVRTYAAWRVKDPQLFYTTTGGSDTRAMEIIGQKVISIMSGKMSSHTLDEIFNTNIEKVKTGQIETEVAMEATGKPDPKDPSAKRPGLYEQGIEVVQVGFSRISFSPNNAEAVYRRMAEERKVQAQGYLSEGVAEASKIRNDGQTKATATRAEALKESERLRGDGDAQALAILAAVQTNASARDFYQYWKSMDFYKSSMTKNTYLVLSSESDLLKNLFVVPNTGSATQPAKKQN